MSSNGLMNTSINVLRSRLRLLMQSKGWSDTDVASKTGASVNTVRRFLDGETKKPQPRFLRDVHTLIGREAVSPSGAA